MVTFETQEDFENAVRVYIENNLRLIADKTTLNGDSWGCGDSVVADVYLTFGLNSDYFTDT